MNQAVNNNARLAAELEDLGVKEYLSQQQHKGLLRFLTCGSVDDGKSTLIGRLLHDSAQIYEDQLASLKSDSAKLGTTGEEVDLALLVDGLQAEREQGITIDVAYRTSQVTSVNSLLPTHRATSNTLVTWQRVLQLVT